MRKHFRQVFQVNMDKVWRETIWRETSLEWRRLASKYWEETVQAGWGKECVENTCVLVCSGCYDKISQSGWLNNRKFFSHRKRPEAPGQGAGRFGFFRGLCWACRCHLCLCPHVTFFLCMTSQRKISGVSLFL